LGCDPIAYIMIRAAFLLLALVVDGRHWFSNAGTLKNGDWIV